VSRARGGGGKPARTPGREKEREEEGGDESREGGRRGPRDSEDSDDSEEGISEREEIKESWGGEGRGAGGRDLYRNLQRAYRRSRTVGVRSRVGALHPVGG
jgi:hypothetical protein